MVPPLRVPRPATYQAIYSIHFFLQLAVILFACRIVGWLGQKFLAQPPVVGEMIAGVVLGPSLLGLVWPELQGAIFPRRRATSFTPARNWAWRSTCSWSA
ncbi:Sodium/hydrogen exchanger family [Sphingomonas paucimobilis]|nr:Sodium/hydrogen exchanger family [Sphingomonas paucimobilis]